MNNPKRVCWTENHLCYIPLPNGKTAVCDEEFHEKVKHISWSLKSNKYVHSRINKKDVVLHRFLYPEFKMIDHINGNKLDNRSCNLRECNHSTNKMNRPKQANNTSGFKGVGFCSRSKKWTASIKIGEINKRKSGFETPIAAAKYYNKMALELAGDFVCLNKFI